MDRETIYKNKHVTTIVYNKEMLDKFDILDGTRRRGRKKQVLDWCGKKRLGALPLINKFLNVSSRQQQNTMKKQLHDYTRFILNEQNVKPKYIDRCAVVVKHYLPTKTKFDLDGVFVKASFDALSDWKFWEDDNYTIVEPIFITGGYDKDNPRSELVIYEINETYKRDFVLDLILEDLKGE